MITITKTAEKIYNADKNGYPWGLNSYGEVFVSKFKDTIGFSDKHTNEYRFLQCHNGKFFYSVQHCQSLLDEWGVK